MNSRNVTPSSSSFLSRRNLLLFSAAALCLLGLNSVHGADGTWINSASGGLWSDAANWDGGTIADGSGATADFSTLNLPAHNTVVFDAPRTLSAVRFGDTASTYFNWTLSNDGNAANVLTLEGGLSPSITVNSGVLTNNVAIAGSAGLVLSGGSTAASSLVLGASNTFTGDVSVNAGTGGNLGLYLNHAAALGAAPVSTRQVILAANASTRAILYLNVSGASYSSNYSLIMRPTGASSGSRAEVRLVNGSATWNGDIVLDGVSGSSSPRNDIYCDTGSSTFTLAGNISSVNSYMGQFNFRGANAGIISGTINVPTALMGKDDPGNWRLDSTGNVWASLQIYNGTFRLGVDNALYSSAPIIFGSSGTAILDMNGFSQVLNNNVTATGGNARRITNSLAAANLSVLTFSNATDVTCAVPVGGKISLVKQGDATLTLTAACPYTGDTVVSTGTLAVGSGGSISTSTNILIAPGATFSSTGFTLGAGQKLAPVDATSMVAGSVNVGPGNLVLSYSAGNPSLTVVNGSLTLSDASVVTVNGAETLVAGQSYLLVSAGGGGQVTGVMPTAVVLNGVSGLAGSLSVSNSSLYLTLDTKPLIASQTPLPYESPFTLFAGASPTFTVKAGGLAPFGYVWYTNGVLNGSVTGSSLVWSNAQPGSFSTYCVITNDHGSVTSMVWSASVIAAPVEPYPVAVMSDNLLGYWRMNEPDDGMGNFNAGVVAHDYWGGKNGIYTNAYLGMPGYSPSTDPTTTSALLGIASSQNSAATTIAGIDFGSPTNTSKSFAVEAWVGGFTPIIDSGIVTVGYGSGGEQFNLDTGGPGHGFRFSVRDASGVSRNASSSIAPDNAGTWHHLVGVCDQPNGRVMLYVDGKVAATASIPTNGGILSATSPMSIGARYSSAAAMAANNYDAQFYGYINDVAIYGSALSSNQVLEHYLAAGVAPFLTAQPVASTNANQNSTLAITAGASGTEPLTYSWFDVNAGAYIPSQTNATLVVSNIQADNSYYLTVANAYGSMNSDTVVVTVQSGLSASLTPNANLSLYAGQTVNYSANAGGTEPIIYRWYVNGALDPSATSNVYSKTVTAGSSSISCLVSNALSSIPLGPVDLVGLTTPTNLYQVTILSNNPVAYWPLGEPDNGLANGNAGVTAHDYVGGHNGGYANVNLGLAGLNGTAYPELTAGLFGLYSPTDSVVKESDSSASGIANLNFAKPAGGNAALSVEAWVNLSNSITAASIVAKGCGHSEQFALDVYNGGFRFVFRDASKTARDSGVSAVATPGQWYHVVGVWDGPNGAGRLYVNGVNVASNTGLATGLGLWTPEVNPNLTDANLVNIGARPSDVTATSYDVQFRGRISHVAIYDFALSTNQIAAHYSSGTNSPGVTPPTPGILAIANVGGGQIQLTWDFSGTLQSATNVAGPYNDEPAAVSPYTVPTTNGLMFYRVRQQ